MANNFNNQWQGNTWDVGGEEYKKSAVGTEWMPKDAAYFTGINPNTGESVEAYQERMFGSSDENSAKKEEIHSGFPGDGRIHVVNDSRGDVYFKPEGDLSLNNFDFKNDGAYKIGTKSWIPLDGLNVNGKVYKISDGYNNILITEKGEVKVLYLGLPGQLHYFILGGLISSPPDSSWNNLFNAHKR